MVRDKALNSTFCLDAYVSANMKVESNTGPALSTRRELPLIEPNCLGIQAYSSMWRSERPHAADRMTETEA